MIMFSEVLKQLEAGKKVTRSVWEQDTYLFVKDGRLLMSAYGGKGIVFDLDWSHMAATDWSLPAVLPTSTIA